MGLKEFPHGSHSKPPMVPNMIQNDPFTSHSPQRVKNHSCRLGIARFSNV